MDTSIIDLCDDSDNDNINNYNSQQKVVVRSQTISEIINNSNNSKPKSQASLNAHSPSSTSSSSSSSSDEELWNVNSGFTTHKPTDKEVKVRKGNYFKEVRQKYSNIDEHKKQSGGGNGGGGGGSSSGLAVNATKKQQSGSGALSTTTASLPTDNNTGARKLQQYELLDSDNEDEEFDEDVCNNSSSLVEKNQAKKKKVAVKNTPKQQEVECIEIDLSSSDNDDNNDGCSVNQSDYYPQKKSAAAAATVNNCQQKKKKSSDDNNVDEEDSLSEFRIRKRPFMMDDAAMSTNGKASSSSNAIYNYKNSYKQNDKNHEDDDDDDDSSTTVPLPPDHDNTNEHYDTNSAYNTKPQQKKKKMAHEEIDLSMDCSDDDDEAGKNGNVTFEVGNDHSFNDDNARDCYSSSSDDDGDKKPSHKKMAAAAVAKKSSMRNDFIDIDSDDSSSSSSSSSSSIDSSNLFTPRPIKKKKKKKAVDAGVQKNNKKRTSFAKDTNLNTTSDKKKKAKTIKQCPDSAKSTISSTSSKLLTPREFSPSSTSPFGQTFAANIAKQQRVPTPAIPAMSASLVQEIGGKLYPDLTHNFIIALTSQARRARHNSYQRASFDSALRSIVVIALHMRPLRSAEATGRMKGVGSNFYDLLKESVAGSKSKKPFVPKKGRYTCVAAAALVALLEMEERGQRSTSANAAAASGGDDIASANISGNDDASSFPMEDLITTINSLLDSRANANLTQSAQQYLNKDNLDPGWCQVKKLCSTNAAADLGGPFLKERKRKGACASGRVFELLDSGRAMAKKLRTLALSGPVEPGPLRQLPDESVDQEFGQVTMSMDFREGGGGGRSLHKMCDQLDIRGVPYVVRELKIADYIFFVGEKLAPVLIERKTADDVAGSLHDGRWEKQQRSMRKAQYVLGGGSARRCQICYIIEGDASKRTVHGGNVGRRTWFQSVDDVENAIAKLPSLGFSVIRSKSNLDTIGILAKVAQDVSWKAKNGNIDVMYTYEQFLSRVKKVGDDKGDPPTDRAHQNPAPPVVVNTNFLSNNTNTAAAAAAAASSSAAADGNTDTTFATQGNGGFDSDEDTNTQHQNNAEQVAELKKLSMARLKEMLKERDEKTGGKKEELISRLLKPRKPELLILRARRKEYVPRVPSSNAALMVALLLNHIPGTQGLTKERLMVLAEETGISKESMSGDGSSFYDGWSGIKQLQEGDPALVRREKGHRYSLTTQPPESAGVAVANALHILAHRESLCTCGNPPNGV